MIHALFDLANSRSLNVLCLGAHCDDIEIGCGGVLQELLQRRENISIHWVFFSSDPTRQDESGKAAKKILGDDRNLSFHAFRDGYFPDNYGAIKDEFERLKSQHNPDIIFSHYRRDAHQDHRIIAEIAASTFRSHLILEYEIPKYDSDIGNPSVFVPLSEDTGRKKAQILLQTHESQRTRDWFTEDTFMSLMRLRGIQCNSPSGFAEAFYCQKFCLSLENI